MEMLRYIIPPLVGAVIGYFTNYIAVKMLFRPLHPVKIGGKTLPFTPGIIPKGKPRLAKALGKAVGTTLLTETDIKNVLLSESMQNTIKSYAGNLIRSELTLKDFAGKTMSPEKYNEIRQNICSVITEKIMTSANNANLGQIIAEKGGDAIKEKVAGTMLAMFIKDELINSLCMSLGEKVNEYINQNGRDIISPIIDSEAGKLENKSIYEILTEAGVDADKLPDSFLRIYISFIEKHADEFIRNFRISEIVEEKVNQMDVLMLEDLLMSIMKKELNAVVNLGALIGLILGTINIFF
ncbi:MAG: DUF445 family protein [Oscillospiraceae bacterium]|nr:DUF445 family protein [Oscillospiraceae bacterium]